MFTIDPGQRRAARSSAAAANSSARPPWPGRPGTFRVLSGHVAPDAAAELLAFVRAGGCVLMAPEPGDRC
jgi:hypothetical protein